MFVFVFKDDDDDQDDVFATPIATPPGEQHENTSTAATTRAASSVVRPISSASDLLTYQQIAATTTTTTTANKVHKVSSVGSKLSTANLLKEDDLYIKFDLQLSELQVICGRLVSDNLVQLVNKGHSNYHLLEKFDIDVSISLCKLNLNKRSTIPAVIDPNGDLPAQQWPPVRVGILISLLKLNIDDSKLSNFYRMLTGLRKTFRSVVPRPTSDSGGLDATSASVLTKTMRSKTSLSSRQMSSKQAFLRLDLNLNEINMAVSMSNFVDRTTTNNNNNYDDLPSTFVYSSKTTFIS